MMEKIMFNCRSLMHPPIVHNYHNVFDLPSKRYLPTLRLPVKGLHSKTFIPRRLSRYEACPLLLQRANLTRYVDNSSLVNILVSEFKAQINSEHSSLDSSTVSLSKALALDRLKKCKRTFWCHIVQLYNHNTTTINRHYFHRKKRADFCRKLCHRICMKKFVPHWKFQLFLQLNVMLLDVKVR